jgi:hypothetical protein
MLVSTARRVIKEETEFLGKSAEWIMEEVDYNPGMFPQRVIKAVETIQLFDNPDPGAFDPRSVEPV